MLARREANERFFLPNMRNVCPSSRCLPHAICSQHPESFGLATQHLLALGATDTHASARLRLIFEVDFNTRCSSMASMAERRNLLANSACLASLAHAFCK